MIMPKAYFSTLRRLTPAWLLLALGVRTAFAESSTAKNGEALAQASANPPSPEMPSGEGLSKWRINDDDPQKSVPTEAQRDGDPLQFGYHLMDLAEKGGVAAKRGDHRTAVKYYAALAKAVPDRSIAFVKLCASYEALGDWEKGVDACRSALGRPGATVADSAHFVRLMLAKRSALSATEVDDVSAVVHHLQGDETTRQLANDLKCEIGVRMEDAKRLEECTTALAATAPDDPRTISYQWALALTRNDYGSARAVIEHAKGTAMPPEGIQRMEEATRAAEPLWRKGVRDWRVTGGATLVVAMALALLFFARRRSEMTVGS